MSRWLVVLIVTVLLIVPESLLAQEPDTANWTYALEWSPDGGMIAVGTMSGLIRIVATTGQPIVTLQSEGAGVSTLAWSPDSTQLASAGWSSETTIWDVSTGEILLTLTTPEVIGTPDAPVLTIRWSPNGFYLAAVSSGGFPPDVFVWDMRTEQLVFTDRLPEAFSLAWKPDSRLLAAGGISKIVIYDAVGWQVVAQLETAKPEYILSLGWSPDGTKLAAGRTLLPDYSLVEVWDTTTWRSLQTFEKGTDTIPYVAWSPDGSAIASASSDGTIRLLKLNSGETITLVREDTRFYTVAWHPSGDRLVYGDVDGTVRTVGVPHYFGKG